MYRQCDDLEHIDSNKEIEVKCKKEYTRKEEEERKIPFKRSADRIRDGK